MKVIKEKQSKKEDKFNITLRLREATIEKATKIAESNGISRQKLLESIVEQVIDDKSFVLKI